MGFLDFLIDLLWVTDETHKYKKQPTALGFVFIIVVTIGLVATLVAWGTGMLGPVNYVK